MSKIALLRKFLDLNSWESLWIFSVSLKVLSETFPCLSRQHLVVGTTQPGKQGIARAGVCWPWLFCVWEDDYGSSERSRASNSERW